MPLSARRTVSSSAPKGVGAAAATATVPTGAASKGYRPFDATPQWSGTSVLAVAAVAGVLGWGFASMNNAPGDEETLVSRIMGGAARLDSLPSPHYATLPSMQRVSLSRRLSCIGPCAGSFNVKVGANEAVDMSC